MTDHSIKGKTVLIAGGAKNLGGLIARDLAAQGAKAITVHYNTSATKQAADETVAAIKAAGIHSRETSDRARWRVSIGNEHPVGDSIRGQYPVEHTRRRRFRDSPTARRPARPPA